jgi:hypothetical protein
MAAQYWFTTARQVESNPRYRHGYSDGYRAATEAFALMLSDPEVGIGEAVRRASAHQLDHLYQWRYAAAESAPPVFESRGQIIPVTGPAARRGTDYRYGYVEGWEAALDGFTVLLAGCHLSPREVVARIREHLTCRIGPWRERGEGCPPTVPVPGVVHEG